MLYLFALRHQYCSCRAGEIVLLKPEDKEKTLNLSGSELDLKEVKFETIEEKETNEGDESLKKLRARKCHPEQTWSSCTLQ